MLGYGKAGNLMSAMGNLSPSKISCPVLTLYLLVRETKAEATVVGRTTLCPGMLRYA